MYIIELTFHIKIYLYYFLENSLIFLHGLNNMKYNKYKLDCVGNLYFGKHSRK